MRWQKLNKIQMYWKLRWPLSATAKAKRPLQKQKRHGKSEKTTAKAKRPLQKQKRHGKSKKATAKAKRPLQKQKRHGKSKFRFAFAVADMGHRST